eukprot:NODE_140_length_17926_cov_0.139620.p7 type:complete len:280 gc:universal NODE_140_length_17926_cov_0.139620:6080-5241(-)
MAFNYFRLLTLALLGALYFYGFSNGNSEKAKRTPTPIATPQNLLSLCDRASPNVVAFGFTEGVTADGAKMAQTLKGIKGSPTAIFFYLDKDFYYQTDTGYSAQLVENGHIVGLRWHQSWAETSKLSKVAFQQAIIDAGARINNQINQYISPSKVGKYYPKYIAFDYADSSKTVLRATYAAYAAELGIYTVFSDFLPESNNENYAAVKANYVKKFQQDQGTLGTFAIALHPGNVEAALNYNNIADLINTTIIPNQKTVISIPDCLKKAGDVYRTGIFILM